MQEQIRVLEVLEHAQRQAPYCGVCGSPTVPAERDGALWLVCPFRPPGPALPPELLSLDFGAGHTRRVILEAA
jgi:hypothetical protein